MKTKLFLSFVIAGSLLASCKKTYVCKDIYNNKIGEVKASSQNQANAMCPSGSNAEKK